VKKINFVLTFILVLSIATCCVISSAMIAWSQSSGPGESTYNYTLVSTAAYCDVDAIPFTGKTGAISGNLNSRVLANDTEFKAISASDDSRWKTSDPGYGDEVFMWFQQTTDEYAPGVKQIDLTFEGYLDTTATFQIRAYNNNTGAWDQIGTTMSIPSGSDSTMTRSITSNCDDYIDSTNLGTLNWGVYASVTDQMNIDYVEAVVSYATWEEMDNYVAVDELFGVWGSNSSDIYAVGGNGHTQDEGTIMHFNGNDWREVYHYSTDFFYDVWGSSSSDIFAVGHQGTIVHYDGNSWSQMSSPVSSGLFNVWGTSSSDVFAVGTSGVILHYNGSSWSSMTSGSNAVLECVWGTSSSDVFAVGLDGTILHYNGSSWSSMTSGTSDMLCGVWGSSATDVFAVGTGYSEGEYYGVVLHYNGSSWSNMNVSSGNLFKVWGTSSSDVFAVGGYFGHEVLHYNGTSWSQMDCDPYSCLLDVWGVSPYTVFAVGVYASDDTTAIFQYD